MIIRLNTASTVPIYVQLRNQIVTGIGRGELKVGEKLPTVRQLALDAGVNTMTVNKTYQILRAEELYRDRPEKRRDRASDEGHDLTVPRKTKGRAGADWSGSLLKGNG